MSPTWRNPVQTRRSVQVSKQTEPGAVSSGPRDRTPPSTDGAPMRYLDAWTGLLAALATLSIGVATPVASQERERTPEEWLRRCRDWGGDEDRVRHCEV